ncbi:hypothetical protein C3B44_02830 [Corynebacterium yudongzhengii]|uniref:Uncharacterized protein n=1 Tax=Corynebacterium yudongzhengii TaxID=2080740 RepID=A0A2U1T518_9CORY|nr:hypothetical protein [Corynebacterium yudongzhengii]AWB81420.1 hypothetical protein C3B44_02830 [Corynebacterium yudongzhengii]PWC01082.1 hypothetical protein DF222_09335 [Corynebacterium yudongzhengii]
MSSSAYRRADTTHPLRRTRGDLLATATITAISLLAIGGAVVTAPVNSVTHEPAAQPAVIDEEFTQAPSGLAEVFRAEDVSLPGVHRPVIAKGLVMTTDGHELTALDPRGKEVFRYGRADREVCSLATAWESVVIGYRSGFGCGEFTRLHATSGEYAATRAAINSEVPLTISSNDRVGTVSADRVELWRSDLVRTSEYGEVPAPQEPDLQPHPGCEITSALTRTELLAVTEVCSEGAFLRLQDTAPEDSREPEISASVPLDSADARLVAVGEDAAAVYYGSRLRSFSDDGVELYSQNVPTADLLEDAAGAFVPATADLPHNMSFFDGERLYLLSPTDLSVDGVLEDVLGTGAAIGDELLVPVADGIAVIDAVTLQPVRKLPVDRDDYDGEVHVALAGETVVEKRGDTVVGLA